LEADSKALRAADPDRRSEIGEANDPVIKNMDSVSENQEGILRVDVEASGLFGSVVTLLGRVGLVRIRVNSTFEGTRLCPFEADF
jgi:hypothetical protein